LKNTLNLFFSKYYIEIISSTYTLNFFIPNFILILLSFSGNYELISEIAIVIGINIIFTQTFSSNARSLILSKKPFVSLESFLIFRIFFSFLFIFLNIIILNYFEFFYFNILFQISILIILQWLNELVLTFFEINNKIKKIYFYLFFKIFFLISIIINILFIENLELVLFIFNFLLSISLLYYFFNIIKNIQLNLHIYKILKVLLSSFSFFSSFSISFANLIWRLLIILFCGKIIAGIYFVGFAIGSLPGTFFNNVIGPSMINKNLKLKGYISFLILSLFLLQVILLFYVLNNFQYIFIDLKYTQVFCTFVSLLGTIFMVKGMYYRQYILQKSKYEQAIFKIDIFYSFLIILIVPILYFIEGYKLIILAFLISSILSYITYKISFQKLFKK
jgi:hypothetical protein